MSIHLHFIINKNELSKQYYIHLIQIHLSLAFLWISPLEHRLHLTHFTDQNLSGLLSNSSAASHTCIYIYASGRSDISLNSSYICKMISSLFFKNYFNELTNNLISATKQSMRACHQDLPI